MIHLKKFTTISDIFQLTNEPAMWDFVVKLFSSLVVRTPNDNFWTVPLLHSLSDRDR